MKILAKIIFLAVILLVPVQIGHAQTNVTLFSVSPTSAKVGDSVVVTGSNLLQCAPVHLNSCNVQFHDINLRRSTTSGAETSNTTVQAVVAAGLCPGTTTIKVGEVNNFSNAIPFTILDEPGTALYAGCRVITSISPTSGTFGATVTINGRNLHSNVQLYDSSFGKTDVAGTMNGAATQVTFNVPNGITPGTYSVRVGPNVNDVSNGIPFRLFGDTSAPFISNIKINNITTSGASVLWDTSEPADGQVEICPSLSRCGTNTPLISGSTTSHIVNLSGLTASTRYYVWVKSKDGSGNLATGGPLTFKTLATITPTPTAGPSVPVISNVQVTNITRNSATVTWNTDVPANGSVYYCRVVFYCRTLGSDSALTTNHTINLTRLESDKIYKLGVTSVGAGGAANLNISFRTEIGLRISNVRIVSVTQTTLTVAWDTNFPANSSLSVCRLIFFCSGGLVSDPALKLTHSVTINNLRSDSRQSYQVTSVDSFGDTANWSGRTRTLP